ncbi:MAG: hypothetical protein Q8P54_02375 [bacterium]|nr:hypothetical protein [bacterium]
MERDNPTPPDIENTAESPEENRLFNQFLNRNIEDIYRGLDPSDKILDKIKETIQPMLIEIQPAEAQDIRSSMDLLDYREKQKTTQSVMGSLGIIAEALGRDQKIREAADTIAKFSKLLPREYRKEFQTTYNDTPNIQKLQILTEEEEVLLSSEEDSVEKILALTKKGDRPSLIKAKDILEKINIKDPHQKLKLLANLFYAIKTQ